MLGNELGGSEQEKRVAELAQGNKNLKYSGGPVDRPGGWLKHGAGKDIG